ncbi:unnamed protein product [Prorocentrum cordatum]|uniref:Amino acid transporter n=1 Tax=Prorocentrum cordatum TaxID=2364126 RepID=A0ABN9WYB2_9DINO|nr:unnamed protein product [Polarella glacialis]
MVEIPWQGHGVDLARGRGGVAHVPKKPRPLAQPTAERLAGRAQESPAAEAGAAARARQCRPREAAGSPRLLGSRERLAGSEPKASKSILRAPRLEPRGPGAPRARSPRIRRNVSFSDVVEERPVDAADPQPDGRHGPGSSADRRCVVAVLAVLAAMVCTDAELQAACSGGLAAAVERLPAIGVDSSILMRGVVPLIAMPVVLALQAKGGGAGPMAKQPFAHYV